MDVRDQPNGYGFLNGFQQCLNKGGFSNANLAGDNGQLGAVHYTMFQHRERPGMAFRPEQELRIRRQRKRTFMKSEVFVVDSSCHISPVSLASRSEGPPWLAAV